MSHDRTRAATRARSLRCVHSAQPRIDLLEHDSTRRQICRLELVERCCHRVEMRVQVFRISIDEEQTGHDLAARLMLLDEAFAGIDDDARAHCMGLIREFDLDFVITSEREWGCYAELPGVAICQLQRREGIDAVFVSRWIWDGREKHIESDPDRRFPPT